MPGNEPVLRKRGVEGEEEEEEPPSARREMQPNGIYKTIFLHISLSADRRFTQSLDRDHPRESRHHPPMGARRREETSIDFEILPSLDDDRDSAGFLPEVVVRIQGSESSSERGFEVSVVSKFTVLGGEF